MASSLAEAVRRKRPHPGSSTVTSVDPGVLAAAAAGLPEALILDLARESTALDDEDRMMLLGRLSFLLSPEHRSGVVSEAAGLYADYFERHRPPEILRPVHVVDAAAIASMAPEDRVGGLVSDAATWLCDEAEYPCNECALLRLAHHLRGDPREAVLAEVRGRLRRPTNWFYVIDGCPAEVCELLGPAGAVELLDRVRVFEEDYDGIVSAARLAPHLPPGIREAVIARMVAEQAVGGDDEVTLPSVLECAEWMTTADRVRLFTAPPTSSSAMDLYKVLNGRGGWLPTRTELIRRLGGDAALLGAGREIVETEGWLP
jgi:hypothetical protein